MNESFDFNDIKNTSASKNIVNGLKGVVKKQVEEFMPLFNKLKLLKRRGIAQELEYTIEGNTCTLFNTLPWKNKLLEFTFSYNEIEEMTVYETGSDYMQAGNSYVSDVQEIGVLLCILAELPFHTKNLHFVENDNCYFVKSDIFFDVLQPFQEITTDFIKKLPDNIYFENCHRISLEELYFKDEAAVKAWIYKFRQHNPDLKFKISKCQYIHETPYIFNNIRGRRNTGETSKYIQKLSKQPIESLLEAFDFNNVKSNHRDIHINPDLLFETLLKKLYDKGILIGMQYKNNYFSDAWRKPDGEKFRGVYYEIRNEGSSLIIDCVHMRLLFKDPTQYKEFVEMLKPYTDIKINGTLSISIKSQSLHLTRLDDFDHLGDYITYVEELHLNGIILHNFKGMPETKNLSTTKSTILTFNNFRYTDYVKNIRMTFKPGQTCVWDWAGFPTRISGTFFYRIDVDIDSMAYYGGAFSKQLKYLRNFPWDFKTIKDPETGKMGNCNFIDYDMKKAARDRVKRHIVDILCQEVYKQPIRNRLIKLFTTTKRNTFE